MLSPNLSLATTDPDVTQSCDVEILSLNKIDSVKPAEHFELTATITYPYADTDTDVYETPPYATSIDVEVFLEGLPEDQVTWSLLLPEPSLERVYRLALFPGESQDVTFVIKANPAALPQLLSYSLIVRPINRAFSPQPSQLKLRILPVDRSKVSTDNPTFYFEPAASATEPLKVLPLSGLMPIQVWVDNRSERVDRFQLRCEGLPKDWTVSIQYPQMALGTGLMSPATGLSLNPRDRGHIQLMIKPPPTAHAGLYTPTLQVISANRPALKLLHLLYIEVIANPQLQASLNNLRSQFRKGPGQYELQLFNSGNIPRQLSIEVKSLEEIERHTYRLKRKGQLQAQPQDTAKAKRGDRKEQTQQIDLRLLPQQTRLVELEVMPKHHWRRPLIGGGYLSNFRINIADADGHSLTPATFQGNTTWMARPWWQLLLAVLLVLGLLGSAAGLIWWFFLRPPAVLSLAPTERKYSAVTEDFAQVDFQLRYANTIQAIRLTGYDSEGKISSAPISYDFQDLARQNKMQTDALPHGLRSLCSVQPRRRLLTCNRVHTGASLPGDYVFQLDVLYDHRGEPSMLSEQTGPVAIAPIPGPTISVPDGLTFGEASLWRKEGDPLVNSNGLKILPTELNLNLEVFHPEKFKSIKLVGKTPDGKIFAEGASQPIWTNDSLTSETEPRLDLDLTPGGEDVTMNCMRSQHKLSCDQFLTEIQTAGAFQIEAIFEPRENANQVPVTAITEPIIVEPSPIKITRFALTAPDGHSSNLQSSVLLQDKKPVSGSYVFFIDPEQFSPENSPEMILDWEILGGASMKVELLLPEPQLVGTANKQQGRYPFRLTVGDRKTITLQVTDANGNTQAKAIEIEAVGPAPADPLDIAEATGNALAEALKENANRDANAQEGNNSTGQINPNQPAELPPRFN